MVFPGRLQVLADGQEIDISRASRTTTIAPTAATTISFT
jgi:hypothetical protein